MKEILQLVEKSKATRKTVRGSVTASTKAVETAFRAIPDCDGGCIAYERKNSASLHYTAFVNAWNKLGWHVIVECLESTENKNG